MNELENIAILIVLIPAMYVAFRFMWHMDKLRAEAFDEAIKKALQDSKESET